MIAIDWRHRANHFELWLQDATEPWSCVGELHTSIPVREVESECRYISAILSEYTSIESALPELSSTNLTGPRLEAIRPWGLWLRGLHEVME